MTEAIRKIETERLLILRDELSKVNYNDLKKAFTDLGVPEAWKAGGKKDDLIKGALQAIEDKQNGNSEAPITPLEETKAELKAEDVKVAEIISEVMTESPTIEKVITVDEPIVEEKPEEDEDGIEKEEVKEVVYNVDDPRNYVSPLQSGLSIEVLERNLVTISNLLTTSGQFHKAILIEKQKQIVAEIESRGGE